MMNKTKTSKAWRWKVATFLPLLALLLMAFGNKSENVPTKEKVPEKVVEIPKAVPETQSSQPGRLIEIRKDGNYIDNKLCSLEEIVKKGQAWGKVSNDWIHLRIGESIPYNRIDEILEQLEPGMYHITQSSVNSDDTIFFMGDVSQSAKFTQGKFNDWMKSQLNNYPEFKSKYKEYKISYSFIVDKNGKTRDGRVSKGSDYPEVNEAYGKILTQIPDWEPAKRGSDKVSVYFNVIICAKSYIPPKK